MNKPKLSELRRLVGNPDAYGVQLDTGAWETVREPLTDKVLRDHRFGIITVGTYVVQPPDQARTLVFDIDAKDPIEQEAMLNKLSRLLNTLDLEYGVEFSGRKGYHLWVVADDYMPAATLYRIGRGVREEAGYPKLEVFPKQTTVRDLGNLVKLPGGKHRVTGKANDFMGAAPGTNAVARLEALAAQYPEMYVRSDAPASIEYPCVNRIQVGFEEGGRNTHLFHLAVMLRKFSLTDENVELIVGRANDQCDPPLYPEELANIIESSKFSGPICDQLDDSVGCGDQCIKARHPGLFTRVGSLKWAASGEEVVVRVVSHTDDGRTVELEHPDIVQGRAILADTKPPKRED